MKRFLRILGWLAVLLIFVGAVWLLYHEVRKYSLAEILESLRQIPPANVALAVVLTVVNYVALIGYDWLGVRAIRHPLPLRRVALASFVSYAASYNFGALLGGTSLRYRLYSAWGLSTVEIVKLLAILSLTLWIGMFALAGVVFLIDPFEIPADLGLPVKTARPIGVFLTLLTGAYLFLCWWRQTPIRYRHWEFPLPSLTLCLQQIAVASIDLLIAAAILYVLLPPTLDMNYFQFLGIYLLAVVAVIFTHVPGGLGILELVVLGLAADDKSTPALLAALILFRVIYYLLPLLVATVIYIWHEILLHHGNWLAWRKLRDSTQRPAAQRSRENQPAGKPPVG